MIHRPIMLLLVLAITTPIQANTFYNWNALWERLDKVNDYGECKKQRQKKEISVRCRTDDTSLTFKYGVLKEQLNDNDQTVEERYIRNRQRLCGLLASDFRGRCVSTQPFRLRAKLKGFVSISEMQNGTQIREVVLLIGPDILQAVTVIQGTKPNTSRLNGMLKWNLLRLTSYW